jgi:hypothetical protein
MIDTIILLLIISILSLYYQHNHIIIFDID